MKILVTSYTYAPNVGGIETVSELMAHAFADKGHEVEIITQTPAQPGHRERLPVIRQPSATELWQAVGRADIVWQNNISLNYLWASLLQRKPTAVTLACAVYPDYPSKNWRQRLKARLLKYCRIFSISNYVMTGMPWPSELIGNPFDSAIKKVAQDVEKDRDIVFLGRLVSDKGGDLLLEALANLKAENLNPSCTIIGDGEEKARLVAQATQLGLSDQVRFTGFLQGEALHHEIARHRIMVVPSRWKEPFGVVALEGIAAGCAIIGSSCGGLVDAVGPCGTTFENNDGWELTKKLSELLGDSQLVEQYISKADMHLERFSVEAQSAHYLRVFEQMLSK